jgi:toxin CptA
LLAFYALIQLLALLSLWLVEIPLWARVLGMPGCLAHAAWLVPRQLLLRGPDCHSALRHVAEGWQLYSDAAGWQPIQLRPDSLALPLIIVLRFRLAGQHRVRALCIARDSLPADVHRRLRVRLKFSRRRWAAPE